MSDDALARGFVATQVGESVANYALADKPLEDRADLAGPQLRSDNYAGTLYDDGSFWSERFRDDAARNSRTAPAEPPPNGSPKFGIVSAAVSEWVARVPGLYWRPGSSAMRELNPAQVESRSDRWTTFTPQGKSEHVTGGVGTLRFPPTDDGYRLVTLTASNNASAGVPTLVSPSIWDAHHLCEGAVIVKATAHWREMPQRWAVQFPLVRGIPRGCLVLDDLGGVTVSDKAAPIEIHPFSVMEYWDDTAQFLDFVYATADSGDPRFRGEISDFFEKYRKDKDRDGSYLLAADISDPMWDATFTSPADMRLGKAAQLRVLEERIKEAAAGEGVADALTRKLSRVDNVTDLKRLSQDAGIEWRRWWTEGGLISGEAARLVAQAFETEKQQALLQVVFMEFGP